MGQINAKLNGILSANDLQKQIDALDETKQENLVSGENIKTINGISLLTGGNMELPGGILQEDLVVDTPVGAVARGTKYKAGTSLEVILREMLCTTARELLYFGVLPEIPAANIDLDEEVARGTFVTVPVPDDLVEEGVSHSYTTTDPRYDDGQYCIYAYPARFGSLAQIVTTAGIDIKECWVVRTITRGGNEYYLCYQDHKTEDVGLLYTFKY